MPQVSVGNPHIDVSDVDEAYATILRAVLDDGHEVNGEKPYREILNYQVHVASPRRRILRTAARPFRPVEAIARLIWMLAGNDRLADIKLYQPKVGGYSDDDLVVPGSNYGKRIFHPAPGLNQLEGAIKDLKSDRTSRRAATVIWRPEDATRDSKDIPCAFGTFYHVRHEQLIATTVMRSNNAFRLFPLNFFEFGITAEIVAASLEIPFGGHVHFAASMHVYDSDRAGATEVLQPYKSAAPLPSSLEMPQMPGMPNPLEQARMLAKLEAELRYAIPDLQAENDSALEARGQDLHDYWRSFYRVLLAWHLNRLGRTDETMLVISWLPDWVRQLLSDELKLVSPDGQRPTERAKGQLSLLPTALPTAPASVQRAFSLSTASTGLAEQVIKHCASLEQDGEKISANEVHQVIETLRTPLRLAARSGPGEGGPDDFRSVNLAEVRQALAGLRTR